MFEATWTLTLLVPDEPSRAWKVSRDELASTLRARMTGELSLPEGAELRVSGAPADRRGHELSLAA